MTTIAILARDSIMCKGEGLSAPRLSAEHLEVAMQRSLAVDRMTDMQLHRRLEAIAAELDRSLVTDADVRRRKAIPSELRAIARELATRGGAQLALSL